MIKRFGLFLFSAAAIAGITCSAAKAAVVLDQSNTAGGGAVGSGYTTGQSFTAGVSGQLVTFDFLTTPGYDQTGNTGSATVSIFSGSSISAANLISSGTLTGSDTNAVDYLWDVSSLNVMLTAGQQYTFALTTSDTNKRWSIAYSSSNPYAGGNAFLNGNNLSGFDFNFKTYVDTAASGSSGSSVPEPASWAMMIGGFGMIGAALRRQRKAAFRFA